MNPPPCPAHRAGIPIIITERHGRYFPCGRRVGHGHCNLQPGHRGECE